jgi:hypothetical protein
MFFMPSKFRFAALTLATLLIIGCAVPRWGLDLPEPIATSKEQMPSDTAMVAMAIQERMTKTGQGQVQNVRFAGDTAAGLVQKWLTEEGLIFTGTQLYLHQEQAGDPLAKTVSGRLDFEGPLGRRASAIYLTQYRLSGNDIVVEEIRVVPIYATSPEPIMLVVPAEALPEEPVAYPDTYTGLLQLVGEHAVNLAEAESIPLERREYVIFVFLLDRISPSSKLEVKISDEKNGIRGYTKSTRYIDFNGWRVALLSGQFILFYNRGTNPLYVKAVFSPGREVGAIRIPQLVGLYCLDGTKPQP